MLPVGMLSLLLHPATDLRRHVVEDDHDEPASATGGVDALHPRLGIEHPDAHFDGIAWSEELTARPLQVLTDNRFVRFAFDVDRGAKEVVISKLGDDVSENPWRQIDFFNLLGEQLGVKLA